MVKVYVCPPAAGGVVSSTELEVVSDSDQATHVVAEQGCGEAVSCKVCESQLDTCREACSNMALTLAWGSSSKLTSRTVGHLSVRTHLGPLLAGVKNNPLPLHGQHRSHSSHSYFILP